MERLSDCLADFLEAKKLHSRSSVKAARGMSRAPETTLDEQRQIVRALERLLNNKEDSDVVFHVGQKGDVLYGNRCILRVRSEVFSNMLAADKFAEGHGPPYHVTIPNINADIFLELLRFLYAGTACLTRHNVLSVWAAADEYLLEGLKQLCWKKIKECLENEADLLPLLRECIHLEGSKDELTWACVDAIDQKLELLIQKDEWTELSEEELLQVLQYSAGARSVDELQLFHAIVRWATAVRSAGGNSPTSITSSSLSSPATTSPASASSPSSALPSLKEIAAKPLSLLKLTNIAPDDLNNHVEPTGLLPTEMLMVAYKCHARDKWGLYQSTDFTTFVLDLPNFSSRVVKQDTIWSAPFLWRSCRWMIKYCPKEINGKKHVGIYLYADIDASPPLQAGGKLPSEGLKLIILHQQEVKKNITHIMTPVTFDADRPSWGFYTTSLLVEDLASGSSYLQAGTHLQVAVCFPKSCRITFNL